MLNDFCRLVTVHHHMRKIYAIKTLFCRYCSFGSSLQISSNKFKKFYLYLSLFIHCQGWWGVTIFVYTIPFMTIDMNNPKLFQNFLRQKTFFRTSNYQYCLSVHLVWCPCLISNISSFTYTITILIYSYHGKKVWLKFFIVFME